MLADRLGDNTSMLALLRQPLVHFLAAGVAIFALYQILASDSADERYRIAIDAPRVDALQQQFAMVWGRPPTPAEVERLLDNYVREEVYYREGLALGLDQDDTVIRKRIGQKMQFITTSAASTMQPSPVQLTAYFEANQARYAQPDRLAFEHIYLGTPSAAEQGALTAAIEEGKALDAFAKPSLLPRQFPLSAQTAVDNHFGEGFYAQLNALPGGQWIGPLESTFGQHVVRILEREAAIQTALAEVKDNVVRDWQRSQASELEEAAYQALRKRYDVTMPAPVDATP
jgi:hypothetical protein